MGASGQRHAPATLYPRGMDPRYPLDRLGGPQTQRLEEKSLPKLVVPLRMRRQQTCLAGYSVYINSFTKLKYQKPSELVVRYIVDVNTREDAHRNSHTRRSMVRHEFSFRPYYIFICIYITVLYP
jgi:hypothetical protein